MNNQNSIFHIEVAAKVNAPHIYFLLAVGDGIVGLQVGCKVSRLAVRRLKVIEKNDRILQIFDLVQISHAVHFYKDFKTIIYVQQN